MLNTMNPLPTQPSRTNDAVPAQQAKQITGQRFDDPEKGQGHRGKMALEQGDKDSRSQGGCEARIGQDGQITARSGMVSNEREDLVSKQSARTSVTSAMVVNVTPGKA
jgi:hypothetical protein